MNKLHMLMNGVFGRAVPAEFAAENYDYEAANDKGWRTLQSSRLQS